MGCMDGVERYEVSCIFKCLIMESVGGRKVMGTLDMDDQAETAVWKMSGASFHLEFNLQGSGFEYPIQFNSRKGKARVGVLHRRYQLGILLSNYTFTFDAHSFLLPPAICVTMCSIRLSLHIIATKLRNDTGVTRTMHGSLSSSTLRLGRSGATHHYPDSHP
jgi:hypothetical protein